MGLGLFSLWKTEKFEVLPVKGNAMGKWKEVEISEMKRRLKEEGEVLLGPVFLIVWVMGWVGLSSCQR